MHIRLHFTYIKSQISHFISALKCDHFIESFMVKIKFFTIDNRIETTAISTLHRQVDNWHFLVNEEFQLWSTINFIEFFMVKIKISHYRKQNRDDRDFDLGIDKLTIDIFELMETSFTVPRVDVNMSRLNKESIHQTRRTILIGYILGYILGIVSFLFILQLVYLLSIY